MVSTPSENKEASSYKYFSKNQLKEYQEIETWLKTISLQLSVIYLNALKRFCEWCGKNPRELIFQRDRELKNDDPNDRTGIRDLVLDFRHHLEHRVWLRRRLTAMMVLSVVFSLQSLVNVG